MLNLFFVGLAILLKEIVGFSLSWRFGIRIVQQILNAKKDLLDCDRWLPSLLFIQDGQANRSRRINIWVEQRRYEFAYR